MKKLFSTKRKKAAPRKKMSSRARHTDMYLASSCFIGAFLAFCITIGSLAGCSMKSVLPGSQGQSVNATQETQAPAGTGSIEQAAGQTSAGSIPGGSSGSVQEQMEVSA